MSSLRIIYELTGIAYTGEPVGDDWTFYIHTGAGLVSFNADVGPGGEQRTRTIGVRERAAAPESDLAQFERELWWASATEHDTAVPEHGVGVFTPVWVPLEPGIEVHRSLGFDVAEAGHWAKPDRVAHLRLDLRARVEELADAPAPSLDATLLIPEAAVPKPDMTAGELPQRFVAEVEGVEVEDLPVQGERVLMVGRDYESDGDTRAEALANFLTHFAGGFLPAWYEPHAALYEIRNPSGKPFWIGRNSSMGQRSNRRLVEAFADAAPLGEPIYGKLGGFEERRSLLVELLTDVHTVDLAPAAGALAELIYALVEQHPERATVEREVYVRTALIDEISGEWTRVFIVDPMPYSGPDELAWMVVWTDSWTE